MLDTTDFRPMFEAKLTEVETRLAEKSAEIAAARNAVKAAEDEMFAANQRYEHFQLTVLRACRHSVPMGSDERLLTLVTAPLDELAYEELERKRAVELQLTRAKKSLESLEWQLNNLCDAAAQLRRCIDPPGNVVRMEVVKRQRPEVDVDDRLPPPAHGAA